MGITMAHIGHVCCIGCAQIERGRGLAEMHVACCTLHVLMLSVLLLCCGCNLLVHGMWWVGVGGGLVLAGCICALGWGITCVDHRWWQWMRTGKC